MALPDSVEETPLLSPAGVAALVRELAAVMHQSAVTELDLDLGPLNVRLRRPVSTVESVARPPDAGSDLPAADLEPSHLITAPMIGTFYASPAPGSSPFVQPGDRVYAGQTIGIIEAMKIMNEISADRSGVVQAILVENGEPVEYGSPLIRLRIAREASA